MATPRTDRRAPIGHAAAERLQRLLMTERRLVGASLLRIGLALTVLYQLLGHWAERDFLWGPRGIFPIWLYWRDLPSTRSPSFFAVDSEPIFQALCLTTVGVALLYLVGWQTRWIGIWFYVLTWSLIARNPLLRSGGESLLLTLLPWVLLLDTSAYFSADSNWRGFRQGPRPSQGPFAALVHNIGLFGILAQLSLAYGFAGVYKLLGQSWLQGTAVYYVLRLPEFALPGLSELIYLNPALVRLLTYLTLAFELSVPLLIWSRQTRWIVALAATVFHLFIATFTGLVVFAFEALIFQLVVLDDDVYRSIALRWGRMGRTLQHAPLGHPPSRVLGK